MRVRLDADERVRFERVALLHLDAAYNLARWLTGDPHAAEDVVQDAYLRAARSFATFRAGDARPWLLTIVRRSAYDWLARSRGQAAVPFDEEAYEPSDTSNGPDEQLVRAADRQLIGRALEALPPKFREVVVLRELQGMSYQEIAAVTVVSVGTVMSRLSRGRERLREWLVLCTNGEG